MANHQHALVRYVTLDRCLARHRLTKEELIARCSAAVSDFTGDHRQLSERTFFNDLQALRDGIILGRCASILCTQGRYAYEVPGRSLFTAGDAEVERMARKLAAMEGRVQEALDLLHFRNAPPEVLAEMRDLLLGDGLFGWVAGRQRAEDGAVKERFRGMMNPSDKLTTEPAFKRRQPMERREVMERKEGDELPPDSTPAPQEPAPPAPQATTPPEGDTPQPPIRSKESKIHQGGLAESMGDGEEASRALRRIIGEVSEMRNDDPPPPRLMASRKPPRLSKDEAIELAFSTVQAGPSQDRSKQGWLARFFQRLRIARLLRVVQRVVD
jgi:hypothetical protein